MSAQPIGIPTQDLNCNAGAVAFDAGHTARPAFVIEKGIPIPAVDGRTGKSGRRDISPWSLLDVGDSVLVDRQRLVREARRWGRMNGRSFTTRKNSKGVRVWRIA
jgi:hypothetical protein